MLIFEPLAGLCNRMRSLDSAMALADATGHELHVIWDLNRELNCRLEDLFELPAAIKSLRQPRSGRFGRRCRWLYYTATCQIHLGQKRIVRWVQEGRDFRSLRDYRTVSMATWEEFFPRAKPFRAFRPIAALQQTVERYCSEGNVIGVHIRRTDNRASIDKSPTTCFLELMQREVDADRSVKFFVATDSPEEESRLKQRFGGRIITHAKATLDRDDPRGIQDAVVDLYSLANCRKLIGSHWSSFTDVAAQIRGIERLVALAQQPAAAVRAA
jgi:hypothetical protein